MHVDVHDGPHLVLLAAQHVAQFELLDKVCRVGVLGIHLGLGRKARLDEFGHQPQILHGLDYGIVIIHPALYRRHLAQLFLCRLGVVPKVGILCLLLLVLEVYFTLSDVKDTSPTNPVVL